MTVTYKFESLNSLADHFENKARELRATLENRGFRPKTRRSIELRAIASELEGVADMLRNTVLEKT